MKCSNCGSPTREGDRFCTVCGEPQAGAATQPISTSRAQRKATTGTDGPVTVTVPGWLASDWAQAATYAAMALAIAVAGQFVIAGLLMLLLQVASGLAVDATGIAESALNMFVAIHGAIDSVGVWATGLLWIAIAFYISSRYTLSSSFITDATPTRRVAFLAKTALIYTIPIAVLAHFIDPLQEIRSFFFSDLEGLVDSNWVFTASWSVTSTFFLGLIASFLAALWAASKRGGISVWTAAGFGDDVEMPRFISAAWAGAKRAAVVVLAGLLTLIIVGTLIDAIANAGAFDFWFALLISMLLIVVFWAAVDVSLIIFVLTARLYIGDSMFTSGGLPWWYWIGVGIVAIGFGLGGFRAAQRLNAASTSEAVGVGMLVAPMVSLIMFAISWFAMGTGENLVGMALALPLLWFLASGFGGFVYANRAGLVRGFEVRVEPDTSGR